MTLLTILPPEGLTIERIDQNGNYEPSNCCWASWKQQNNNRTDNVILTINGVKHTLAQWSELTGIPYATVWFRIKKVGWNVDRAVIEPVHMQYRRKSKNAL